PRYATRRFRHGPPKSASTRIANEPNAERNVVCWSRITLSANAKTAGITIAARAACFREKSPGSTIRSRRALIGLDPRLGLVASPTGSTLKASRDETSSLLYACRPSQSILFASAGSAGPERVDGWVPFNPCTHLRRGPGHSSPPHGLLHRARHGTRRWSEHGILRRPFGYRRSDRPRQPA